MMRVWTNDTHLLNTFIKLFSPLNASFNDCVILVYFSLSIAHHKYFSKKEQSLKNCDLHKPNTDLSIHV
jgi:hypothetical protein